MPKRPSSVLICPDDTTILCGDKFGDVYSLPLIPLPPSSSPNASSSVSQPPAPKPKLKQPSATALTVHSKANLNALNNQLRALATTSTSVDDKGTPRTETPAFEHTLQLGHVSMLTALTLGEMDSPTPALPKRRYIITADRDEHIRVSRFMPHAHIIESFCMGHQEFVSALAIPPARPDLLVSGGGDPELLVWDWVGGRIVDRVNALARAREVAGEGVSQVAVVALLAVTTPGEGNGKHVSHVLAILEGVPALFHWRVGEDGQLVYAATVSLSGNPLHITSQASDDCCSRVLVAVDIGEPHDPEAAPEAQVASLKWQEGCLVVDADFKLQDHDLMLKEPDTSSAEVRQLLYSTAILRKYRGDDSEGEEGAAQDVAAPEE